MFRCDMPIRKDRDDCCSHIDHVSKISYYNLGVCENFSSQESTVILLKVYTFTSALLSLSFDNIWTSSGRHILRFYLLLRNKNATLHFGIAVSVHKMLIS